MAVAAAVAVAVAAAAAALPELAVQVVLILLQRKYYKYNDVMYNMVHGIHIFYIQYIYIDIVSPPHATCALLLI